MGIFDIWDQSTNTEIVNRAVEATLSSQPRIARQFFAPMVPTSRDKIRKRRMYIRAVGKGRFVAPDATPPIYRPRIRVTEEEIELARMAEMSPVELSLLRQLSLTGSDEESQQQRERAGADILTRARVLQLRMENQTDWMIMEAITKGQLTVEMADEPGQEYVVDYDFLPSHIQTVGTTWDNLTTATPLDNMRAAQLLLADDAGDIGVHFWMQSKVWRLLRQSKQIKDYLTPTDRSLYIPQENDIKQLLEEPQRVTFHITDSGWLEEGAGAAGFPENHDWGRKDFTKWIPDDHVIITTDNPFNGENIAETFDGLAPIQTAWRELSFQQGAQSDVYLDERSGTHMWRQQCHRMVRVNLPECIFSMKVL